MISAHITLLAEFGWLVGFAWFVFISHAFLGLRQSPRIGIAFAGLVVSGCSSTIFDWPVAERGCPQFVAQRNVTAAPPNSPPRTPRRFLV